MKEDNFLNKFILTCNPWFLSSAVMLLYGIYQVRVDKIFLDSEELEVLFSFFTLQVYEAMALFSAWYFLRRKLSYDAVFLIVVVGILSLIPFLNLSQALHLENDYGSSIAISTSLLAFVKFILIKRFMPKVNLPWLMLIPFTIVLAVNTWIPNHFKELNVNGKTSSKELMLNIIYYVLPTLGVMFFMIFKRLKDSSPVYNRKWIAIILSQIWFVVTVLNLISMQYVYSIALEKETILVGTIILAYLWGFEYGREYFRIGALALANILVFSLSADHTILVIASIFHMGLALIWFSNRTARILHLSTLIFIIIANPDILLARQIPAFLLIISTLCFALNKSKLAYFLFALYSSIFLAITDLDASHEETTFLFGALLGLSVFMLNYKDFNNLKIVIFGGLLTWALYGVYHIDFISYKSQLYSGISLMIILAVSRISSKECPVYFFSVPIIHFAAEYFEIVMTFFKGLPISSYIITASFLIFAIGFYLNVKKSKISPDAIGEHGS